MSLATAMAIAPGLDARERDPGAERTLLDNLATWAIQFTPQVCLDPPAGLVLEIEASLRLFGGIAALRQRILEGCQQQGLSVQTAIAPTPLAARWLAQGKPGEILTDVQKLDAAVAALPIHVLDTEADVLSLLQSVGVHTLGQCQHLPRAGLARRGGRNIPQQLDRALGLTPDPRPSFQPSPQFHARQELMFPVKDTEALLFVARRLLLSLTGNLASQQAGVEYLDFTLEQEGGSRQTLHIRLGTLSRDEQRFLLLAREHLARITLTAPVQALALAAPESHSLPGNNRELFGDCTRAQEERSFLVERLRARLGTEAVLGLALHADHRPEMAWRRVIPGRGGANVSILPQRRPLWLLPEPAALPDTTDGPGPLLLLAGPERIASGWWDDPASGNPGGVERDYYLAQGAGQDLLWVYRDLQPPGRWYLHGVFS